MYDYRDVYRWTCCGVSALSFINVYGSDVQPSRSPGCKQGPHEVDHELTLDLALADRLRAVQKQLNSLEAREVSPKEVPGVFISYSHLDTEFVDGLATRFEEDEIEYWRDEKDLLVGDVIDRVISDGIQSNALFLTILSPSSLRSKWVERELDEASYETTEGRKILLPVLLKGLKPEDVPARLRRFKCADFTIDFEGAYRSLKKTIVVRLGRLRPRIL
jgi:hypothetical protein